MRRELCELTRALLRADSDTSTFGTFSVANPKELGLTFNETYTLAAPGPNAERQEAPHEHHAVLDPTQKYILVPDLGADLIRVFKTQSGSTAVTALEPVKAVPGSGPRHGGFAVQGDKTFFYTLNELSNTITGYTVVYDGDKAPVFTRIFDISDHGEGGSVPAGTKAAELVVSVSHLPQTGDPFSCP